MVVRYRPHRSWAKWKLPRWRCREADPTNAAADSEVENSRGAGRTEALGGVMVTLTAAPGYEGWQRQMAPLPGNAGDGIRRLVAAAFSW